mgnify:FL=1
MERKMESTGIRKLRCCVSLYRIEKVVPCAWPQRCIYSLLMRVIQPLAIIKEKVNRCLVNVILMCWRNKNNLNFNF